MTVIIDKFGRIIIPKKIRKAFGLKSGQKLALEITNEGLLVKPEGEGFVELEMKGDWLVGKPTTSEGIENLDIPALILQSSEDRIDHFLKDMS